MKKNLVKKYLIETFELPHISGKSKFKTHVPPEKRSFRNLPRDSNRKPKIRFQEWLDIDTKKRSPSHNSTSYGKSANGKFYGWSHRAVFGFKVGQEVKKGSCGNKYDEGNAWDEKGKDFEPYTIKTEKEAEEHAIRFAEEVS